VTLKRLSRSLVVRRWTRADNDYVAESVNREGWGYTRRDMERCWKLEPNGCFIAETQNKRVGHVFSVSYGKLGWIGLLIVNPDVRGQGIGSELMKKAIDYLRVVGAVTIRLEAAERAIPLYQRLGFIEDFDSLRFRRLLLQTDKPLSLRGTTFQMHEDILTNLAEFDARYFGANRLCVLRGIFRDYPQFCLVAEENECTVGYVMARRTQKGYWIGPWVCDNSETAQHLFTALIDAVEEGERETELRVGLPALNARGRRLMKKLGFQLIGKSVHMVLGNRKNRGDVARVYGIGGPEKG